MKRHIKKHSKIIIQKVRETKKKVKLKFFLFLFIVSLIIILSFFFYPQIKEFIQSSIEVYGFLAVFLIAYMSDILMQPIAPDIPIAIGIFFGLNPIFVTLSAIIASALATITGYYLGIRFGVMDLKNSMEIKNTRK